MDENKRLIDNEQLAVQAKALAQETGDNSLYWQLVLDNQAMIYRITKSILGYNPSEDEFQIALLAAMESFVKWNPDRGHFSMILRWKIMKYINVQEGRFGIKIPIGKQNEVRQAMKVERRRFASGLPPSLKAICPDDDTLTFAVAFLCMNRKSDGASVHYVRQHDETENALEQLTVNPESEDDAHRLLVARYVQQLLPLLPERQRLIVTMRHMEGRTLQEIGEVFTLSRERVRQIDRQGLEMLRYLCHHSIHERWDGTPKPPKLTNLDRLAKTGLLTASSGEELKEKLPLSDLKDMREV